VADIEVYDSIALSTGGGGASVPASHAQPRTQEVSRRPVARVCSDILTGMFAYDLKHLFSFTATLRMPPEVIGPLPDGIRATAYVLGGEMNGARVRGRVLPVGGDWLLLRPDGIGLVDVRLSLQTDDDALIYMTYSGVIDLGSDGYAKFLEGEMPATFPVRTAPRFQTGHSAYLWLNRMQCLGIGEADTRQAKASYDIYAVL
jgi:hypothetical protein